jgi:hypothetical protein
LEANGVKNWVSLSEGQQGSLGWLTTNERKDQMALLLREAMTVGRICIHERFFSVELELREARKRVQDELLNYCVVTEAPKTTFGKVRRTYTGKLYGRQDDLCIAIQLAIIGQQTFWQNPKASSLSTPKTRTHTTSHTMHCPFTSSCVLSLAVCHSTETSEFMII